MAATITLDEARARFGEILHAGTRTYREFDDPEGGGIWRPIYVEGEVVSYRLYEIHRVKRKPWTMKRSRPR